MSKRYLKLDDINAYRIASELSDYIWSIVSKWDWFNKRTLGCQWVKATDSIAANIAEGFGRYHKKDKQKFYYNARGSAFESAHWTKKAFLRDLITQAENEEILKKLRELPKELNYLIKVTEEKLAI